jgi:DNA-binding transcriptional LysR family regulator
VAFVLGRRIPEGFEQRTVFTEPFVACLPAAHPASRRRSLTLPDLRDESFVLFSRSASPDYHAQILDMCAAAGFFPRVRHELRHWLSVVALVAQGLGVAVVPAALRRSALAGAVFRPLADSTAVSELRCVWRSDAPVSAALTAFVQVVEVTEAADRVPVAIDKKGKPRRPNRR